VRTLPRLHIGATALRDWPGRASPLQGLASKRLTLVPSIRAWPARYTEDSWPGRLICGGLAERSEKKREGAGGARARHSKVRLVGKQTLWLDAGTGREDRRQLKRREKTLIESGDTLTLIAPTRYPLITPADLRFQKTKKTLRLLSSQKVFRICFQPLVEQIGSALVMETSQNKTVAGFHYRKIVFSMDQT